MGATSSREYNYEPLDVTRNQIRLLVIVTTGGTNMDSVRVSLETYNLETAPPYVALSSTWEDPNPRFRSVTYPVNIDGTYLRVGRTLHLALLELRDKLQEDSDDSTLIDLPLWVDQICIDQRNATERNHQVMRTAMMY